MGKVLQAHFVRKDEIQVRMANRRRNYRINRISRFVIAVEVLISVPLIVVSIIAIIYANINQTKSPYLVELVPETREVTGETLKAVPAFLSPTSFDSPTGQDAS